MAEKKVLTEDEAQEMREVMKPIFHTQVIQGSELLKRVRDATRGYMGFC